jgi:Pregnancy-associated plasma protein-A
MAENAQPKRRTCATMQVHERMMRTVPGYMEARAASENHAWRATMSALMGRAGITRIPVVVHVVHKTQAQNISDAQIHSQIEVLTADFRRTNGDAGSVPAAFAGLVADARIEFELATTDPAGQPTSGITRTKTTRDSFDSEGDAVKSAATGGADPWPSDRYLNIWVCQLGGGLLGYAQFPGGPAATDGVVILHSAFGTTGTAAAPFNLGRTTTHEVGHWLNLRHIWGDDGTGCFGSDFVPDTPNQGGPNYGTPAFPSVTCGNAPSGDMFMNYMDYVDDAAMFMFTAGQVTRMQATLDGLRSSIGVPVSTAKEPPKDAPKDLAKDQPKDLPQDQPKGFLKDLIGEVPKSPFEGQKFFFETPTPFGGVPAGVPGGGVPFVLATPTAGGQQPIVRQQAAMLAAAYLRLMSYYARLYARGMLDAEGMAAWQEVAAAYQQLVSSSAAGWT